MVEQNKYAQAFNGVLRYKTLESAKGSVAKIDELFHYYRETFDMRGQHQAQLMALIGRNRAEGAGKYAEAQLFADWLIEHLPIRTKS